MTLSSTILAHSGEREHDAASPRLRVYGPITLAVLAVAIAIQVGFGLCADVSWLISVDERWVQGAIPYRDFIEINPPASLLLYLPAVKLALALGMRSEFVVACFGFASIGASVALSAAIFRRAGLAASVGRVAYAFALIGLAILPGEAFCERDYLAAVYGLPFLALCWARCEKRTIDLGLAVFAGLGLGLMVAIKPPFALCVIVLAPYLWARLGWRVWLASLEYYVGGALFLAYVVYVPLAFPTYAQDVMRMGVEIYLPIRDSFGALMLEGGSLVFFLLALIGVYVAGPRLASPQIAIPGLAGVGAFGAFVMQGKGWLYQALPLMIFLTIAAGFVLGEEARSRRSLILGALAMVAAALLMLVIRQLAVPVGIAALAAALLETRLSKDKAPFPRVFMAFALASTVGAAAGLDISERPLAPSLGAALARLGPHPTVVGITEDMGFGHPMTRRVGAVWTQRVPSLFIMSAARRIMDEHPGDAAVAARMRPYIERDKRMLIQDIERSRPDALLVGPLDTDLHRDLWADPEFAAARAGYRLFAVNDRPDFKAELWVRVDLAGSADAPK